MKSIILTIDANDPFDSNIQCVLLFADSTIVFLAVVATA